MWTRLSRFVLISTFFLLLGCGIARYNGSTQPVTHARSVSPTSASTSINPGKFTGTWIAHGAFMTIARDGKAVFEARTYSWCGPGVPQPCDSIKQNQILYGHHQQLQLSQVNGSVARGVITSSNTSPTNTAVTLTLQSGDTLLYTVNGSTTLLCGPSAAPGTCGA